MWLLKKFNFSSLQNPKWLPKIEENPDFHGNTFNGVDRREFQKRDTFQPNPTESANSNFIRIDFRINNPPQAIILPNRQN